MSNDRRLHSAVTHFLCIGLLIVSPFNSWAEAPASPTLKATDIVADYSTKGHQKAKGIDMKIGFPKAWKAEEGDRPNVVQKFVSPKGYADGSLVVTIGNLPDDVSDSDIKGLFVGDGPSDILPDGARQLDRRHTKIEQLPADIITYIIHSERAGMQVALYSHTLVFVVNRKLVAVNMSCGLPGGQVDDTELARRGKLMGALFTLCINRIVVPAAWNR